MEEFGEIFEADEIDKSYEYLKKEYESFSDFINEKIEMYDPEYD